MPFQSVKYTEYVKDTGTKNYFNMLIKSFLFE